jgi:TetR/AcrR family transcriptional repressor of nem operon
MKQQSTKDHLLQVGLRRIHADGYGPTGLNELLAEAEIPKGSFYHHFGSKEAFAQEVLQLYAQREAGRAAEFLSGDKPPLKRLRRYFEELIRVYGAAAKIPGCLLGNLTLEVSSHSDALQPQLSQAFAEWQSAIAGVLRQAIDTGDLPRSTKPDRLAGFLINAYEGALLRSKADRSNKALETFLQYTFDDLLK